MSSNVTGTRPVRASIPPLKAKTVSTLTTHVKYPLDGNSGPDKAKLRAKVKSDRFTVVQSTITISGVEFGIVILGVFDNDDLTFTGLVSNGNRLDPVEGNLGGGDRHVYIKQAS